MPKSSDKASLVGRCGLYCGACAIYRAERDRPLLRERLAGHFNCSPEEVGCIGCAPEEVSCWTQGCERSKCLADRELEYCALCSDAHSDSCALFAELRERYLSHGFDVAESLALLREKSASEWLKRMGTRFGCPACGASLILDDDKCPRCGKEVSR